jgi:hypothetical protein
VVVIAPFEQCGGSDRQPVVFASWSLRCRARPPSDLHTEHHRRGHALASADTLMSGSKSGLDQRFFPVLQLQYAGAYLSETPVSVCSASCN